MIFEKGIKVSVYGLYVGLKLFGILSGQGSDMINKKNLESYNNLSLSICHRLLQRKMGAHLEKCAP